MRYVKVNNYKVSVKFNKLLVYNLQDKKII